MQADATFDRIAVEAGKCGGKPYIRNKRISVRRVLEYELLTRTIQRWSVTRSCVSPPMRSLGLAGGQSVGNQSNLL